MMFASIRPFLAAAAMMVLAATAHAALSSVENVYEVSPREVRLPVVESGTLNLLPCSGCKAVVLRTTPETLYHIDGREDEPATLARMREALRTAGATQLLLVAYRLEDKIVTRVVLGSP